MPNRQSDTSPLDNAHRMKVWYGRGPLSCWTIRSGQESHRKLPVKRYAKNIVCFRSHGPAEVDELGSRVERVDSHLPFERALFISYLVVRYLITRDRFVQRKLLHENMLSKRRNVRKFQCCTRVTLKLLTPPFPNENENEKFIKIRFDCFKVFTVEVKFFFNPFEPRPEERKKVNFRKEPQYLSDTIINFSSSQNCHSQRAFSQFWEQRRMEGG